jgi:hypothetical protein
LEDYETFPWHKRHPVAVVAASVCAFLFLIILGLLLASSSSSASGKGADQRLTMARYNELRIGMHVDKVYAILGERKESSRMDMREIGRTTITWSDWSGACIIVDFEGPFLANSSCFGL